MLVVGENAPIGRDGRSVGYEIELLPDELHGLQDRRVMLQEIST